MVSLARSSRSRARRRKCLTWSPGPSCAGSTSRRGLDQGADAAQGLARNTIRVVLRSQEPPVFRCPERWSKLDPFKDEIHELLRDDARLTRGARAGADRAGGVRRRQVDRG